MGEAKIFTKKWDREEKENEQSDIIGGVSSYGIKNNVYKKWWFWMIVVIAILLLFFWIKRFK